MGVFNNLVMYDQDVPQAGLNTIVPDLATEWSWNEERTELTFRLRQGVKWHDGKPFTAKDVKCTFDLLLGGSAEKLRLNPRKPWYRNLDEVVLKGDDEVIFRLKRPQPAFIAFLASGFTPIYPCHVPARECGSIRSAQDRSSSSNSSRTNTSRWSAIPITGKRTGPISTASNDRSSRTRRPGSSPFCPAKTI